MKSVFFTLVETPFLSGFGRSELTQDHVQFAARGSREERH